MIVESNDIEVGCPHCGRTVKVRRLPVGTMEGVYAEMRPEHDAPPPRIEVIQGEILSLDGISGLAKGTLTIRFDADAVLLERDGGAGNDRIAFTDVISLQFAGRGHYSESSEAQIIGGGFGLDGAAKGILEAALANYAISRITRRTVIETFVGLQWRSGSLVLFNTSRTPEDLAVGTKWVVDAMALATETAVNRSIGEIGSPPSSADVVGQLERLHRLHQSGGLSDGEFAAAKGRLIGESS